MGLDFNLPSESVSKTSVISRFKRWIKKDKKKTEIAQPSRKLIDSWEQFEDSLGVEVGKVQRGLTFLQHCGWFQRTWTFQEIVLARNASVRCGNSEIPWEDFSAGWRSAIIRQYKDWRDIRRETGFIEQARLQKADLLFLFRCVWDREATDLRDKVFGVLGLLQDDTVPPADYNLSVREAYVRFSRHVIERARNLELIHFSGLANALPPEWGPFKEIAKAGYWTPPPAECSPFDEEQDGTGGWHLPSWVPDFGSPKKANAPQHKNHSLVELHFPWLDPRLTTDVRWQDEHLVAAGLALGRLVQVNGSAKNTRAQLAIAPFPDCAFSRNKNWAFSHNLGRAFASRVEGTSATKIHIGEFARKVNLHDEGQCGCPRGSGGDATATKSPEDMFDLGHRPFDTPTRPLDWVIALFGARSPMMLRPDRQIQTEAWDVLHPHQHMTDGFFSPSFHQKRVGHTFVLVEPLDDNSSDNGTAETLDMMREFGHGIDRLGCLSLVYGDFILR